MKNIFVLIAFLCGSVTFATAQNTETVAAVEKIETVKKEIIKVKGATCKTDLGMIVANIEKLDGVSTCEVLKHGAVTTLEVSFDEQKTDLSAIRKAVMTTGTCENPDERRYQVKI